MSHEQLTVRLEQPADRPLVEAIYPQAFPDEDLVPLLRDLWRDPGSILPLVALTGNELVAHAMFTRCTINNTAGVALLGPIAVQPDWQGRGLGSALIRDGFQRLAQERVTLVCVLGDPGYYGRFGFAASNAVKPPYTARDLPEEWQGAWQTLALKESGERIEGRLQVPAAWDHESLWLP
jgi:putative acetyltransferase